MPYTLTPCSFARHVAMRHPYSYSSGHPGHMRAAAAGTPACPPEHPHPTTQPPAHSFAHQPASPATHPPTTQPRPRPPTCAMSLITSLPVMQAAICCMGKRSRGEQRGGSAEHAGVPVSMPPLARRAAKARRQGDGGRAEGQGCGCLGERPLRHALPYKLAQAGARSRIGIWLALPRGNHRS